ncbi:MAG: DUF4079 domain-containing protein, partial [Kovacikia sp.]
MELNDVILLLHPVIAVIVVFPLLGVVVNRALQVRQRRLAGSQNKIPAGVGQEHVQLGRLLTGSVVGLVLLALANDVLGNIIQNDIWTQEPFKVALIGMMFGAAIASLILLYQAKS